MYRLGIFFERLLTQCARHSIPAELIIVEWNPLPGRKRLAALLKKPECAVGIPVRIITVPEKVHNSLHNSGRVGLFEFYAKNVGIRRAGGEFILSTNNDLLFTEELIQFLSRRELRSDCFYRVDRHNLSVGEIPDLLPNHLMKYCDFKTRTISGQYGERKPHAPCPPDDHKTIHVHACGDFTLMPAKAWRGINGYPQIPMHGLHCDSLGLFLALMAGYRQIIIRDPARIYHIDHSHSAQHKVIDTKAPILSWNKVTMFKKYMDKYKKFPFNKPDWGFAEIEFEERVF